MSKRAEEAAKKKYPIYLAKAVLFDGNTIDLDANEVTRNVFRLGYEQAEKDLGWHSVKESLPEIVAEWEAEHLKDREMKAIIKETGQAVEVVSRFMPKKRNAPSRDWMCNLSNGTCINESELEYISDNIEDNRIIDIDNVAREYAENHYSEWEVKMKAPDKIYLGIQDLGSGYVYDLSLDNNGEQEYIRKDALLEWANKRLEEFRHIAEISNDVAADGEVDAFEELIDKLNEM